MEKKSIEIRSIRRGRGKEEKRREEKNIQKQKKMRKEKKELLKSVKGGYRDVAPARPLLVICVRVCVAVRLPMWMRQ